MKNKNIDKQHHGALGGISGYRYEAIFFVQKLVELLLQNYANQMLSVTRTKKDAHVDDIHIKTKITNIFYQCRGYADYRQSLFVDFISQFNKDRDSFVYLITQKKNKWYAELAQDARKFEAEEFLNNLYTDSQRLKHKQKFESLLAYIDKEDENKKQYIYEFLKHFSIIALDDIDTEIKIKEKLIDYGYTLENAEKIYNKLYTQADSYNWQGVAITTEILKQELRNLGITPILKEELMAVDDKPTYQKFYKQKNVHILQNSKVKFYEKLSYLLNFIENLQKLRQEERKQVLKIISQDNTLSWHFLKNLKNPNWFIRIKDTVIKSIIDSKIDSATKYQLLNYFETCAGRYSDKIIPLLVKFEENTKNPNILAALVRTIAKLKPSKKENLKQIWRLLEKLAEHQHPWVRKEIPETLKTLAEYNLDKSLSLLEKVFLFNPVPRDVTQGSPTLALTFQGRDNENWVFEQASKTLRELMADKRFVIKTLDLTIKLEINSIKEHKERREKVAGITLDYSYIWLSNDEADKLDYEYDRRKRFALEIEKCLDSSADSDVRLTKKLFNKLLQAKYEVFYLAVIKILMRYPNKYLELIEDIVFDKSLWTIHNIQDYFLQTLICKYFELKQNRLPEYIQSVKSLNYKNDTKKTDYFKQHLLISIPQKIRTKDVNQELERLEDQLKIPARIEKSFVITSWSGLRPDIETAELKKKTDDGLIKIMEDCTANRRKVDTYNLSSVFSQLIKDNPNRLPVLLDKMKDRQIDQRFSGEMMRVYIEVKKINLQDVLDTFWKLQKTDTWAKTEIARFLNGECRKEKTPKINKDLLKQIKEVLFELSSDKDPDNDETTRSSNPRPEDAITRGINSVRGVATEVLVVLLHYFPQDKEIIEKLKLLAKDKTKAVRATLIYNLKLLVTKNYALCKYIVNQFKNERDPGIDFALIHYFACLDPSKFQANQGFIKLLFNNPDKEIQKNLGKLIGHRYVSGFNLAQLVEAIIKQQKGETETRRSLAFVFESRLGEQIAAKRHKRIIEYFKRLLDPELEPDFEVRERASFVFERNELQTKYFDILYRNGIFDILLKDKINMPAQNHLINYLQRCIFDNESFERCIEILHSQVINIEGILSDHLIVQKIAEILNKIFDAKISKKTKNFSEEIFDKGLERGWDEFYSLFQKFKECQ